MLETNLATRPFYNDTAVRFWLGLLLALVLAGSVYNAYEWLRFSKSDTERAAQASEDEARAAELRASAARLRATVDADKIRMTAVDASQANDLIGRRTFSWTELFNQFEATIPADVRITSVRQRIDRDRGSVLTIIVHAKGVDEINAFIDELEATGLFHELLAQDEAMSDNREVEAVLEAVYRPASAGEGAPVAQPTAGTAP
jgi:Tfp pilus assembly protein PilN